MSLPGNKPYGVTRSAAMLTVLSVLSPLSGLAMEMALAWRYGSSGTVDAFRIAALVIGLGSQLFFGYLLPHVVIPLFSEYRAKGDEQEAWRLAFSLTAILSAISLTFIGWLWFDPQALVGLLGPGLAESGREDAGLLVRCFGLAFLLMAWSGVASGILYVHRIFWLSAIAQLLPNLLVILAVVAADSATGAGPLALGVLLGYAAMLGLFVHGLIRVGGEARIAVTACFKPCSLDALLKAFHLATPLLATIFIGQWSVVVINRALSTMPSGTLAEFGYAWKLLALISLLPTGLATVIFPAFSEAHAKGDLTEFSRLVTRAFRMTLLLTVPLAVALIVERIPVISMMFGRGGMNATALIETGQLLGILLIGAPAGALSAALGKVAFSMHDTRPAMAVALVSALAITALVPAAAEIGGAEGVMWTISAVAWGSTFTLLAYQVFRYQVIPVGAALRYFTRMIFLSIGVALPVMAIRALFTAEMQPSFGDAVLELVVAGLVSIAAGVVLSRLLGVHEASEIARYIKWQVKQIPFTNKSGQ